MKFSCTQENLSQGLSAVSHVASKNINLPILNNILIKADTGLIKFSATNLEVGVSCIMRGKVEEDGEFTVPAKVLYDYVALLPREKVDVVLKANQLEVSCNNYNTKIKGEESSEFPLIPQLDKKQGFVLNAKEFLKALQQVVFAVAISETRPEISGVYMDFNADEKFLILAATDSYRLAERKIKLIKAEEGGKRVIVPAPTLQEVQRILGSVHGEEEGGDELTISLNDNQILFSYKNVELISRVINGQYPEYKAILPGDYRTQIIINNEDLMKAVKSSSLFVKSGINDIFLEFKPEKEVVVSSVNAQVGENVSSLEANITGAENSVVLNYRYLLDGLQAVGTSEVLIEAIDNNTPVVLKPISITAEDGIDKDYLYLIMPIKQ